MARNGSGTYSKVNTFVAGTVITASDHNENWDDLVSEMTNSVAVDGQSTMTGQFKAANGTVGAPGITFGSDLDCGLYRIGGNNIGAAVNGAKVLDVSTTGLNVVGTVSQNGALVMPVGAILDYGGSSAPTGWLLCYGQAISRSTYSALFSAIGTVHGAGDGSTTFNVPDLRGRTTFGKDDMGGSAASRITNTVTGSMAGTSLGAAGGTESHTLTVAQSAAHTHTGTTATEGAHTHVISIESDPGSAHSHAVTGTTGTESATHTHALTTNRADAIAVTSGGGTTNSFLSDDAGSASIGTSGNASATHTHDFAVTSATESAHTHVISGTSNAGSAHSHTITTDSTGGGAAHNNMPPGMILNKIIFAGV